LKEAPKALPLRNDAYGLAYKALSLQVCEELKLEEEEWSDAYQQAMVVFVI